MNDHRDQIRAWNRAEREGQRASQIAAAEPISAGRTWVKMFAPQFADAVRTGRKLRTIRSFVPGKIPMPQVGDRISCCQWTGRPFASATKVLAEGPITNAAIVEFHLGMHQETSALVIGGERFESTTPTGWARQDAFAKADGFESWPDLLHWFGTRYGPLPFMGLLIEWRLDGEQANPAGDIRRNAE